MSMHKSYCRNCSASCGVEVEVEDNRIVEIRGDPDHPVTRGYMCIKGRYSRELHNGEDRILTAQKRKPDGSFAPIDSLSAIGEAADALNAIIEKHGPRSVGLYYGTGACFNALSYGMARTWLAGIGSPEHYSSFTVDQSAKWVCLSRMGLFATGKPMIEDVDVMLIAGNNPVVSHLGFPLAPVPMTDSMRWLKEARKRGAKLIVIDPRRTETARQADIFLQIKPGEDATLFAAMIRLILEKGWADEAFCNRFVTSVETLRSAVADFTLDYASERTGIPADQILAATEMFGTSARCTASSGTGTNMSPRSNLTEHLLECLNALCGGYRRAGDPIKATGAVFDLVPTVETVLPPSRDWDAGPRMRSVDSGQLNAEFPTSRLPDEILHDGEDRVRALIVCGGNPVAAIGDTERTTRAFDALEMLVVLDPRMTETSLMADYVIPTKLPFERPDMTLTQDNWFAWDFVQFSDSCVEAPDGMLEDWEVFWELGRLMNAPMDFRTGPFGVSLPKGRLSMEGRPSSMDMLRIACADTRVSVDELKTHPSGVIVAGERRIEPAPRDDGNRLDVCPGDVFEEIRALRVETPVKSSEYEFLLTSRRAVHVLNSAYQNAAKVVDRHPMAPIFMNPADIAEKNLEIGSSVEIVSSTGKIFGQLTADPEMRPGVVSMPHNWGSARPGKGKTSLTSVLVSLDEAIETINFMPRQSAIPVNVRQPAIAAAG